MIDISSAFAEYNGSFPSYTGKNATGAGSTDGTEFIAALIDNWMWGPMQALLSHESITPNGVTEAAGASQILDAIQNILPPGMVVEWNINTDPASYGARYLLLNGQGILRANYSVLDANVYVGDGNNTAVAAAGGGYYHADDAAGTTPNTTGIYLILPESRGYTTRGLDSVASVDPDGASRYLGDAQLDAMQRIEGTLDAVRLNSGTVTTTGVFTDNGTGAFTNAGAGVGTSHIIGLDSSLSTSPNTAKTDDVETRMTNRSTQFAIRY